MRFQLDIDRQDRVSVLSCSDGSGAGITHGWVHWQWFLVSSLFARFSKPPSSALYFHGKQGKENTHVPQGQELPLDIVSSFSSGRWPDFILHSVHRVILQIDAQLQTVRFGPNLSRVRSLSTTNPVRTTDTGSPSPRAALNRVLPAAPVEPCAEGAV